MCIRSTCCSVLLGKLRGNSALHESIPTLAKERAADSLVIRDIRSFFRAVVQLDLASGLHLAECV